MTGLCPCEGDRKETEADCKDHGWAAGKNDQQSMSCFHIYSLAIEEIFLCKVRMNKQQDLGQFLVHMVDEYR